MTGIYDNSPEDRMRERQLNEYLDSTCVAPERHAKALARAMAKILRTDSANPNDGGAWVGEALSEQYQRIDRPIADLIREALEQADSVDSADFDHTEIGRIVCGVITDYLYTKANEAANDELADMDEADREAAAEQRLLDSRDLAA